MKNVFDFVAKVKIAKYQLTDFLPRGRESGNRPVDLGWSCITENLVKTSESYTKSCNVGSSKANFTWLMSLCINRLEHNGQRRD